MFGRWSLAEAGGPDARPNSGRLRVDFGRRPSSTGRSGRVDSAASHC